MILQELIAVLPDARVSGPTEVQVTDVAHDSRCVTPGSLFVAVPSVSNERAGDVNLYTDAAIRAGAIAVVTPDARELCGVTTVRVPDTRSALADLAVAFFRDPSRELQVFGVTGTDGKTTTSYLLDAVLSYAGFTTGLMGTIETRIGSRRVPNQDRMTTPDSLEIQRTLKVMLEAGVTHVALEASSHALALRRLRGCRFRACALTNVTGDHVEFHGSWDAYVEAKALLFTDVGRDAIAVLNRDDDCFELFSARTQGRTRSYGIDREADVAARDVTLSRGGYDFTLAAQGQRARVELKLPGRFNVSNALAAAGMALEADLSVGEIAAGLSAAQPPPGRMQHIRRGQPFEVIVDYGHTPNAFRSVLSTLRKGTSGRLIAVFGATGNRDRQKRPVLAQIARDHTDFFVITNEDPFGEDVESIMAEVAAGVSPVDRGSKYVLEPDRKRAITLAIDRAEPGDTVVILGKGHETSIVSHGTKVPWSDATVAADVLESRG